MSDNSDQLSPFAKIDPKELDGLNLWVAALRRQLATLNEVAEESLSAADDEKIDLIRARQASLALSVALEALAKFGISNEDFRGLIWLQEELLNATAGASSPITIRGAKKRGAPPRRADKFVVAMVAGQAIKSLSPFYDSEKDAIVAAQAIFEKAGLRSSAGGSLPIPTLTDWYKEFLTDESAAVTAMKQQAAVSPPQDKEEALRRVRKIAAWATAKPLYSMNMD
ncbi:hypothetical protein [Qipengyuania sp. 902]|uniref:hypothetical protein n=1 Tax=Qipengyuania sp. 902 TaxID=3417565 RepID=UPI003EB705FE